MAAEKVDMDAILDAALDELDDDEKSSENAPAEHVAPFATNTSSNGCQESPDLADVEMAQLGDMMKEILSATSGSDIDEAFGEVMAKVQQQMAKEIEKIKKIEEAQNKSKGEAPTETKSAAAAPEKAAQNARPVFGPEPPPQKTEVDRTISKLLDDMASATSDEEVGMDEMMKEFENLGGEDMIDGMMQQLLTKDLMYEPIKEVTTKFPKWLEDNRQELSEQEYTHRCNQYAGLQGLLKVYETEPENSERLFELMKEVQEFGLPPSDIVVEIAPDLSLDEDGVPQLKSLQDCCVM